MKFLRGWRGLIGFLFFSFVEEMFYIEFVKFLNLLVLEVGGLYIVVIVNCEVGMYIVWWLIYLENEDLFLSKKKKRRILFLWWWSFMVLGLLSGVVILIYLFMRESFGVLFLGKRIRKSVRIEENEKVLDNVFNFLDLDKCNDVIWR